MAQFNEDILQSYYDSRNYQGAADYLRSFPAKNPQAQRTVNSQIRQLERDAAIQANIAKSVDDNQYQAYSFMQSMMGQGNIPRDKVTIYNKGTKNEYTEREYNSYGTEYLSYLNNLKSDDGTDIDRIAIDINSDEVLSEISSVLDCDIKSNDLGIIYNALGNGKHRLVIPTSSKNLYKVMNAANSLTDRDALAIANNIAGKTAVMSAAGIGAGSAIPGIGNVVGGLVGAGVGLIGSSAEEIYNYYTNNSKLDIKGVDVNGKIFDSGDFNSGDLEDAIDIVNEANEVYNGIMEQHMGEQTFTSEVVSSQFLGAGHAEAYKLLQDGKIDQSTFNQIEERWQTYYDRLMTNADFSKNKVYAWSADSGEGINLSQVDNADIPDLKGEVLLAMKDGRLNYSLSTKDGVIGTMITITPKNDGKEGWSSAKGEVQKMIFVEGLFEETANDVFNRDTKTIAARQNADMKKYNYEQRLSSGLIVGYDQTTGSYAKKADDKGKIVKIPIGEDEMLKTLNESAIIDNSVSEILANMDENGNLYPQVVDGKTVQPRVEDLLEIFANSATNEIYPKGSTTDVSRAAYQNQLYRKMYDVLNGYLKNYKK